MTDQSASIGATAQLTTESTARLYVLDANVLMHDPTAIFRFKEHDVYIPMAVLEALDAAKKGTTEVARNVRQVSRVLDSLIGDADRVGIDAGLDLPHSGSGLNQTGHLYLQTGQMTGDGHASPSSPDADDTVLGTTLTLARSYPEKRVVLVSKDINLRIKARVLGIQAEDYSSDQVLEDVNLLYSGVEQIPEALFSHRPDHSQGANTPADGEFSVRDPQVSDWYPNQCVYGDQGAGFEAIVSHIDGETARLRTVVDHRDTGNQVWGICARNREQNFALNLLMDPDIDFVSVLGVAGTGKTLLTLAAGLAQTVDAKRYREIVVTRATVPVGDDIGFLPGTEEEKMTPWMGALLDNLEVLTENCEGGEWGRLATTELLQQRIKIRSLNFMRGRTFLNRYIIIDEAQNITAKQMKTLITRAGPGSKVICLGNITQIDTPYLSETTSGLTYVVDRFKDWRHSAHIVLMRGERSRLTDYASSRL